MAALIDSLLAGREDAAAQAVRAAGWPGPRSEAWKYTSLRALERRSFAPARATTVPASVLADIPAPRIVLVNGHLDAALSDLSALPAGVEVACDVAPARIDAGWQPSADDVFASLASLLACGGVRIHVRGTPQAPLHLAMLQTHDGADRASHARLAIHLDGNARMTLIEHQFAAGEHANLDNTRMDVTLDDGAVLQHLRWQDDAPRASRILRTQATLARNAHYRRLDLELGAAWSRHELRVRLSGAGSEVHASGVLVGNGRRHLDTRLDIVHAATGTRSTLPWRGLADDRARVVFRGGIGIDAGADGSQADLQNRNLLLSDDAEIDTQPVLVIHADEVQAAHGATVGQLDPAAVFYLRARGIAEAEARRMLTAAFCRDVLGGIRSEALRARMQERLDTALARMQHP